MQLTREERLRVRLIWAATAAAPVFYCVVTVYIASTDGGELLEWRGLLDPDLPFGLPAPIAVGAVLTPVWIVLARSLTGVRQAAGDAPAAPPENDEPSLDQWLRREMVFMAVAELPAVAALVFVVACGHLPVLWTVSAATVFMFAVFFPSVGVLED